MVGVSIQCCMICMSWLSSMSQYIEAVSAVNSLAFVGRFMKMSSSIRGLLSLITVAA